MSERPDAFHDHPGHSRPGTARYTLVQALSRASGYGSVLGPYYDELRVRLTAAPDTAYVFGGVLPYHAHFLMAEARGAKFMGTHESRPQLITRTDGAAAGVLGATSSRPTAS